MFKDRPIVLLAIGQTLVWAGIFYLFPALLLRWEQSLGWSKPELTAAISVAVLISALCSPIAGRIIDTGRGPLLMAGSALIGGAGVVLLAAVTVQWQFYLLWAIIGAAMAGCLYEPCFALVTRARGINAKDAIIFITLVAGFASSICFPLMHTLAEALGWRSATRMFGLVVILVVVPILWFGAQALEQSRTINTSTSVKSKRYDFLGNPAFWFLAIGFALTAVTHGATLQHLLPILDDRGLGRETAILAASFIGPMQVAGRLAMMASQHHVSLHGIAVTAFVMMALSIIALLFSGNTLLLLAAFVILFGGSYGTVSILRPLIARNVLGEENFGAKSGALALPYLIGAAGAPYAGSVLWELGGYNTMLSVLVAVTVAGCGMYLLSNRWSAN